MRGVQRALPLETAAAAALGATVILVLFGASSVSWLADIGRPGRWVGLAALAGVLLLLVLRVRPALRPPTTFASLAVALGGLALVSSAWSVAPSLSLQRAVTLGVLLAAGAGAALAGPALPGLAPRLLAGLAGGAALLCLGSILLYLAAPGLAVQGATLQTPDRFRGLGENPNTLSMLIAVALPAAAWLAAAGAGRVRALWLAAVLLLAGIAAASGSRGALVGGLAGTVVIALLRWRGRRLAAALAAAAAVFLVAVAVTTIPKPDPLPAEPEPAAASAAAPVAGDGHVPALGFDPNEVGRPRPGGAATPIRRTLFGSSGRAQAWDGAIRQAAERPLLGFGFGTEERVFVDRYYVFDGSRPENSYIGLALQLGLAGLALFLAAAGVLALRALRLLRRGPAASAEAAAAGVVAAGLLLGVVQSYVYSVGNVATIPFWLCAFLLGGAVVAERAR